MKWIGILLILALILAVAGWLAVKLLIDQYVAPPKTHAELKELAELAIKETGGPEVLEKEAKAILSNFEMSSDRTGYFSEDKKIYPAIMKLCSLLPPDGRSSWVVAHNGGIPAHVVIRFGSHAHYAYIWMFDPADMPLRKIEEVEHLGGTVYLAEKNE